MCAEVRCGTNEQVICPTWRHIILRVVPLSLRNHETGASMYISDSYLEQLIREDVPDIDLTTHLLGIGTKPGASSTSRAARPSSAVPRKPRASTACLATCAASSSPRARVLRPATSSCAYGARPRRCTWGGSAVSTSSSTTARWRQRRARWSTAFTRPTRGARCSRRASACRAPSRWGQRRCS